MFIEIYNSIFFYYNFNFKKFWYIWNLHFISIITDVWENMGLLLIYSKLISFHTRHMIFYVKYWKVTLAHCNLFQFENIRMTFQFTLGQNFRSLQHLWKSVSVPILFAMLSIFPKDLFLCCCFFLQVCLLWNCYFDWYFKLCKYLFSLKWKSYTNFQNISMNKLENLSQRKKKINKY